MSVGYQKERRKEVPSVNAGYKMHTPALVCLLDYDLS